MGRHPEGPRAEAQRPVALESALKERVTAILDAVSELDGILASAQATLDERASERELLIQEQWRLRKELATLQRVGEQYDTLAQEHDRLAAQQSTVRDGLQALLTAVKTLAGEVRRGY